MAEEKQNMNDTVKQIQDQFEKSMDMWTDMVLGFEVKTEELKILPKKYDDESLMNVTVLFRHVLFNIGFFNGLIDDTNAESMGYELANLIKKYSGIDTRTFYK